jgi:glycosyltransferase involved in cell wall biosynthesis
LPREAEDAESETALAPTDVAVAAREDTAGVSALPPTALYLPVGDANNPEPVTAPPRYMPAPTLPPLPEFELANFSPDPHPLLRPAPAGGASVRVDGLIFTAVLAPKDGRKNWQDILTAFTTAFRDTPDATLVLKMIGADPAFWWWELNGIAKTLPPFACRVVVINGFLQDAAYADLIAATHFVVNASLAEGQCLPLAEFMSAGRPAIAPRHTAMRDYITSGNALIVGSEAEFCSFPQDPRNMLTTTRYRIEWPSLCAAFTQAAGIIRNDPDRYVAMGQAAMVSLRAYCSDETVSRALASFLGLGDEVLERAGWQGLPRDAAEPVLGGSGLMDPGAVAFAAAGALP